MSNERTIGVTLHIVTNAETGEQWIARPDFYFDEEKTLAEENLDDRCTMARISGTPEKEIKKDRAQALALIADVIEKQRAKHAAAREGAEVLCFTLQPLTSGADYQAKTAAKDTLGVLNPDALGFERLCRSLVVEGENDMKTARTFIREQSPLITHELIARVNAMVEPNPRRMVLTSKE